MSARVFGVWMVFVVGCVLLMVGLFASTFADCPRPLLPFQNGTRCAAFAGATGASVVLMLIGGIGAPALAIHESLHRRRNTEVEA